MPLSRKKRTGSSAQEKSWLISGADNLSIATGKKAKYTSKEAVRWMEMMVSLCVLPCDCFYFPVKQEVSLSPMESEDGEEVLEVKEKKKGIKT